MVSQAPQSRNQGQEKPVAVNNAGGAAIREEAQEHSGLWRRFVGALYEARLRSAQREVERHRDAIASWRRHLAERKKHLHLVPDRGRPASTDLGTAGTPARKFQALGRRAHAVFIAARQIIAEWRRRVRTRNELTTLGDSDLRDIGWTRAEVQAEVRKPFWRSIASSPPLGADRHLRAAVTLTAFRAWAGQAQRGLMRLRRR
jgi:uncharacterized protein YjiS (DUF1127 family)